MASRHSLFVRSILSASLGLGVFASIAPVTFGKESPAPVAPAGQTEAKPVSLSPKIATAAERVLRDVKSSTYSHKIEIDVAKGQYICDCSGLVAQLVKEVAPASLAAIEKAPARKRPLAEDFYATFTHAPTDAVKPTAWLRIEKVTDIRPGDVIAWKSLSHLDGDHTDTGHVMIADAVPVEVVDGPATTRPVKPGGKVYRVVIIDSTKSGHADDTRKPAETGVGRGAIFFETKPDGTVGGYYWKKVDGARKENPVSIGRAMEMVSTDGK